MPDGSRCGYPSVHKPVATRVSPYERPISTGVAALWLFVIVRDSEKDKRLLFCVLSGAARSRPV